MRSRGQLEIAMLGCYAWMPYAPHGVKGLDDELRFQSSGIQHHVL